MLEGGRAGPTAPLILFAGAQTFFFILLNPGTIPIIYLLDGASCRGFRSATGSLFSGQMLMEGPKLQFKSDPFRLRSPVPKASAEGPIQLGYPAISPTLPGSPNV